MKHFILLVLATMLLSACASVPSGSRVYIGRIECREPVGYQAFETVYALDDEDARRQINHRLDTYTTYLFNQGCGIGQLTAK